MGKSPRDKMVCILNSCRVIGNVLQKNSDGGSGADDFLPLLIWCLMRANPVALHSNVEYISYFRHPSRMQGEEGYFFMTFHSAVTFIRQITYESLLITEEEFEEKYKGAMAKLEEGTEPKKAEVSKVCRALTLVEREKRAKL